MPYEDNNFGGFRSGFKNFMTSPENAFLIGLTGQPFCAMHGSPYICMSTDPRKNINAT